MRTDVRGTVTDLGAGAVAGRVGTVEVRAEKGHLRETGNVVFHLALVGVLVGVALSAWGGYRGDVLLLEGRGFANVAGGFDDVELSRGAGPDDLPPFLVGLSDVRAEFDDAGAPVDYAAAVTVAEASGAPSRPARIAVNEPLSVGGAQVYLQNVGYSVVLDVTDGSGAVQRLEQQCLPTSPTWSSSCVVKLPDAAPVQLAFSGQLVPTAGPDAQGRLTSVHPRVDDPALVLMPLAGDLGLDSGVSQNVYALPVDRLVPAEDRRGGCDPVAAAARGQLCPLPPADGEPVALRPGDVLDLPEQVGSVRFVGVGEWGRLTVVDEPGQGTLLASGLVLMGGLVLSLRGRRRRVWLRARPSPDGGSVVEVGGLARHDADSADEDVAALREQVEPSTRGAT